MSTEHTRRVRELFDRALEMDAPLRAGFVAQEAGDDPSVRDEVLSLLAAESDVGSFLATPAAKPIAAQVAANESATIAVGSRIGRYSVERLLGIGGMGAVFVAQQDQPQRRVAIKVMRSELATPSAIRRFEHESHVLGSLLHPGIAQIYEAGTHGSAESEASAHVIPYFAMELIEGARNLLDFARDEGLGLRGKLQLFQQVCAAIEYAHQRGVIHRDLKPGNILVDRESRVKVIDFGVARITDPARSFVTRETQQGSIVGTLRYMSPEQCDPDSSDGLDTRSDVYALGVVLFELLTGAAPYDLTDKSLFEAIRIVREQPPFSAAAIDPALKGDVDTIVSKALRKERDHRYASVGELSADIGRYLRHEPILARAQSTIYQVHRFVRRHRGLVLSVVTLFVASLVTSIVTYRQRQLAIQARDRADLARQNEVKARDVALDNAGSARETLEFLNEMLANASPLANGGRDVTVREVVDAAAEKLDARKFDRPRVEAEIRGTLGTVYVTLDRLDEAIHQLRRSVELLEEIEGPAGANTLRRRQVLATALSSAGKPAVDDLREIIRLGEAAYGDADESVLLARSTLASILLFNHQDAEGIPLAEKVVATCERIGRTDAALQNSLLNLAFAHIVGERFDRAEETLRRILNLAPEGTENRCFAQRALAEIFVRQRRFDEALDFAERSLAGFDALYRQPHSARALAAEVVGKIHFARDDFALAEPHFARACEMLRVVDTRSPRLAFALVEHGLCLAELGRDEEARRTLLEAEEMFGGEIPADLQGELFGALAESYEKSGDLLHAAQYRKAQQPAR